ncbi:MAG: hypothetical protein KDD62_01375 [Bdellovibrionales bacterium]|nr:hypothetical protein [Bdellovibrionales bacterium]
MSVYFLGPEGSYSHIVASQYFSESDLTLCPCGQFTEISRNVINQENALGVLPIENSTTSNVHENIEQIFSGQLKIVGEAYLAIKLHLLACEGTTLENLVEVHSHEKALAQCSSFVEQYGLHASPSASTSDAAEKLAFKASPNVGVIGSRALAERFSLQVLSEDIGNEKHNLTRFVVVQRTLPDLADWKGNKCSLTFMAHHQPGALAAILTEISDVGGNLTYIQSKPIPGQDFHYNFWIDIEAAHGILVPLVARLQEVTLAHDIVGFYSHGTVYSS